MSRKKLIMLCMIIGSVGGSVLMGALGASALSVSSLLGSTIGGILGIWVGVKIS